MDRAAVILRLEQLREARSRAGHDASLAPTYERVGRELKRAGKRLAGIAEAWEGVCPGEFLDRTSIMGLGRGVLTIGVSDAATLYELDRMLGAGARTELVRACPTTVRRVRLVLSSAE